MSEYQNPEEGASLTGKDKPKLVTLAVLHMAQYFPAAFTAVALPCLFRKDDEKTPRRKATEDVVVDATCIGVVICIA